MVKNFMPLTFKSSIYLPILSTRDLENDYCGVDTTAKPNMHVRAFLKVHFYDVKCL